MPESKKQLILKSFVIFLLLVFIATGYYFFVFKDKPGLPQNVEKIEVSQEPRVYPEPVEAVPLPKYQGEPVGVINEDKTVSGTYPEATKSALKNELLNIAKSVLENPDNLDNWLRAGVIKKFFGDFLGARDAWEYASLIRPQNSTSFANLGGLYALYLKDPTKAEFNYKKAIENSPGDIYLYTSLADLYQSIKQDRVLYVEKTIQSGLAANNDNITLLSYLARFYKEQGNIAKAIEYYQKVLAIDPLNQAIKAEIEELRRK